MNQRRLVRAIVYDIKDGEFIYLLLKAREGYWQNPQGGIDSEETEIEALIREVKEETGLDILEIHKDTEFYIEYEATRNMKPQHTKLLGFAVRCDCKQKILLSEEEGHTNYKWVNYKEALSLLTKYPEQIQVFENVVKKLNQK